MTMRIAEIMSRPVQMIGCSFSLAEARERMTAAKVRHLVVMDRGRCVGVLSDRDIYRWEAKKPIEPEVLSVGEAMSPDVYTVSPDAPLGDVALEMARLGVGSAVVLAGDEPVGIFTTNDALRLLSRWIRASFA
jgi:acetoin utilization protein AcuB